MRIEREHKNLILIKENGERVDINDGAIIEYTGIYYKKRNDVLERDKIETKFIGRIECEKYAQNAGGTHGIYVNPLYIWDHTENEWKQIINYKFPQTKYFLYPHLLTLPEYIYNDYALDFLHTCKNADLNEFTNIKNTFDLIDYE
jgi:hypothetical protein